MGNATAPEVHSLFRTTVEVEPVAAVFNITNVEIETFLQKYFSQMNNIEGVAASRCVLDRTGASRQEILTYVFFNLNSKDILSKLNGLTERLQAKMDIGNLRASDRLFEAAKPLVKDFKLDARPAEKLAVLRLNIFRVLGLMLGSDYRRHDIIINEVKKLSKKEFAMAVIKSAKFVSDDNSSYDRYVEIAQRMDDRDDDRE